MRPCPEDDSLAAFAEGGLSAKEREEISEHLGECEPCRTVVSGLARALDGQSPVPPAPTLAPALVERKLQRGDELSRYLVLDVLGEGGMSVVYLAYDPQLDRKVAVKMLRESLTQKLGPEARSRALREGKAMARVSHPHVVPIHDVGTAAGSVFLAMEYVEGSTLRTWLKEKPRTETEILNVFIAAAEGLAAAHLVGLIHRDFKPENVLIGRDGRVRVADFGLVRAFSVDGHPAESGPLTFSNRLNRAVGTPAYMAPEQHRGDPVDARADQYSFCVSLYEAFAGKRPDDSVENNSAVPRRLLPLLRRGLALNPRARHPAMEDIIIELRGMRGGRTRRRAAAVAVTVLALLSVALAAKIITRAGPACEDPANKLSGIWDSKARARVEAAFDAVGKPFAHDAFSRVALGLDGWAREYSRIYRATCEADSQADREFASLSALCLDAQREEVRAMTEELSRVDFRQAGQAAEAVTALPSPGLCVDASRLALAHEQPNDEKTRDFELQLARAAATEKLGRYAEAAKIARDTADEARQAGHVAIAARAKVAEGLALANGWQGERAEPALREAFALASEAHDDEAAADAAISLVQVLGGELERFPEAHEWAFVAEGLATRAKVDLATLARLYGSEGQLFFDMGENDAALHAYERAMELRRAPSAEQTRDFAANLYNHGRVLVLMGRVREGLQQEEEAMRILVQRLGPSHPNVGTAWSGIAWAALQAGEVHRASEAIAQSLEVSRANGAEGAAVPGDREVEAEVLLAQGRYEEASALGEQSGKALEAAGRRSIAALAWDVRCSALSSMRQHTAALQACDRALADVTDVKGLDVSDVALAWDTRGHARVAAGKPGDAMNDFQRAFDLRTEAKKNTLISRIGLARCSNEQKKFQSALSTLGDVTAGLAGVELRWRVMAFIERARANKGLAELEAAANDLHAARAELGSDLSAYPDLRARIDALLPTLSARGDAP